MNLLRSLNKPPILALFAGFAFVLLNTYLLSKEIFLLPVLPLLIVVAAVFFLRIDRIVLFIVFFVPLSLNLSYLSHFRSFDLSVPTEPALAFLMLLFLFKYFKGERLEISILRHPVSLAIYFYLAWIFITSVTSTMPLVSFKFLIAKIWFILAFYFIAAQMFIDKKNIRRYLWAYIIPFTIVIIYSLVRHAERGLNNQMASHFVVKPFYNDHTSYGAVLAMLIPVLIGLYLTAKDMLKWQKVLFISLLILYFAATVFSYTRAAWVSLIFIAGLFLIILFRIKLPLLLIGAFAFLAVVFTMREVILVQLERNKQTSSGKLTEHVQSITNVKTDASNRERLNRWSCAWRMFLEKPLFGWGPGTYMFQYAPFQLAKDRTVISTNAGTLGNAHSEYLGPLAESGVLGVLSFLLVVAATVYTGLRVYFNSAKKTVRIMSLSVLLGLCTYYVHGILNNFLDTDKASALFWGFTAILVTMDLFHVKDEKDKEI